MSKTAILVDGGGFFANEQNISGESIARKRLQKLFSGTVYATYQKNLEIMNYIGSSITIVPLSGSRCTIH